MMVGPDKGAAWTHQLVRETAPAPRALVAIQMIDTQVDIFGHRHPQTNQTLYLLCA
jgi:hypothetical protein